MLVPHLMDPPPYLGKRIMPPISGIGYHWKLQKQPIFRVFSWNLTETTAKSIPFPEKMEIRMRDPSCIRVGGGGGGGGYRPGFREWGNRQDCEDTSSTDQAKDHHTKVKDQTDAIHGLLHIPICLWIMDLNKRPRKEDTGHRDEMLSQTPRHLVQRPHHQWGRKKIIIQESIQESIGPFDDPLTTVKKNANWSGMGT